MKSLNDYINESLLDDLDDLEKDSDNAIENVLIGKFLNENYDIYGKYIINNRVVDVNGLISVKNTALTELTNGMFVFGTIDGTFDCSSCTQLKSLEGSPKKVGGNFYCYGCDKLKSLKGAPEKVDGSFYCANCTQLKSLEGSPKKVGGDFDCNECASLTSLKGAPKKVGGDFECSHCKKLTSLEGAPKKVGGDFECSHCKKLTSLEGAPKKVGSSFFCISCGAKFTKEQVIAVSNISSKYIYVN